VSTGNRRFFGQNKRGFQTWIFYESDLAIGGRAQRNAKEREESVWIALRGAIK